MYRELHVVEKSTNLFWGLTILVSTAVGTYLLAGSFVTMDWDFLKPDQFFALTLFAISFWGIIKLSEPLYHFILHFEEDVLSIEIHKGSIKTDTIKVDADQIEELKFAPHYPRSSHEALFDFSTSYHLLYKKRRAANFEKLLGDQSASITLKVDDIAKIMRFITEQNPKISIPREQSSYFNL